MSKYLITQLCLIVIMISVATMAGCARVGQEKIAVIKSTLARDCGIPVVEFRIQGNGERGVFVGRGQAIAIRGRFLTAAHVLPDFRRLSEQSDLVAVSRPIGHALTKHGECADTEQFRTESEEGQLSFEMVSCDWAMGTTDRPILEDSSVSLEPYEGKLRQGASVSLFRASSDGRTTQRFDTRVVIPEAAETFPDNLVFLAKPSGFDHHGWSGCFVGEQVRGGKSWKLIGVLSAAPTATDITTNESVDLLVVVRPPVSALEWFLDSSD